MVDTPLRGPTVAAGGTFPESVARSANHALYLCYLRNYYVRHRRLGAAAWGAARPGRKKGRAAGPAPRGNDGLPGRKSGGADLVEEARDIVAQGFGLARQFGCGRQHLAGGGAGGRGGFADLADVAGDFLGALGGLLDVARDLLGRGTLLLDGRGDGGGDLADLGDGLADALDRLDRAADGALDGADLGGDLLGCLGGLAGQSLDLARHDGEALAGLAGARGLDGRVEREQVGLLGDVGDQIDHFADFGRRVGQTLDGGVGLVGLGDRALGDLGRLVDLTADLAHGRRHLLGQSVDRLGPGLAVLLLLRLARGGLRGGDHVLLEHGHGLGHLADLVLAL